MTWLVIVVAIIMVGVMAWGWFSKRPTVPITLSPEAEAKLRDDFDAKKKAESARIDGMTKEEIGAALNFRSPLK